MSRFPESITLTTDETITLLAGVETVVAELQERGELAMAFELENAIAAVREKFVGGSDLPPVPD